MTWLGILNRVVLQWFFVRLARVIATIDDGVKEQTGWMWLIGIVPLSGWGTDYKFVSKRAEQRLNII